MVVPVAAALLLLAGIALPMGTAIAIACVPGLIGAVIAAVHHAEVVAHRVGEPFGTLVLAIAITV
jgi:Ca2+:H+ antiporter